MSKTITTARPYPYPFTPTHTAVETQRLRIGAQESLDVGVRGELVEPLFLEQAQVLSPDLRPLLHLRKVEPLPRSGLAQACAYLEHAGPV